MVKATCGSWPYSLCRWRPKLVQNHGMTQLQVRRRRVDTQLAAQGFVFSCTAIRFEAKLFFGNYLGSIFG